VFEDFLDGKLDPQDWKRLQKKDASFSVNMKDSFGWTALIHASNNSNRARAIQLLQIEKADIDLKDNSGKTALMHAACRSSLSMLRYLVDAKANPDVQDKDGKSALMHAAYWRRSGISFVRILVEHGGANLHLKSKEGLTAADWAEKNNHPNTGEYLRRCQLFEVQSSCYSKYVQTLSWMIDVYFFMMKRSSLPQNPTPFFHSSC